MMVFVGLAYPPHPLQRLAITHPAPQRIAGIGGIGDQLTLAHDIHSHPHQAGLRIARMNFEVLRH